VNRVCRFLSPTRLAESYRLGHDGYQESQTDTNQPMKDGMKRALGIVAIEILASLWTASASASGRVGPAVTAPE